MAKYFSKTEKIVDIPKDILAIPGNFFSYASASKILLNINVF